MVDCSTPTIAIAMLGCTYVNENIVAYATGGSIFADLFRILPTFLVILFIGRFVSLLSAICTPRHI